MQSHQTHLVVVDTNVLVSGLLSACGPPGRIVDWLRAGTICAVLDDRILAEYEDVVARPELKLPQREVKMVLSSIRNHARWIEVGPHHVVNSLPDPGDVPFAECARAAECSLVTGNKKHYPGRVFNGLGVLSPREFVEELVGKKAHE